MLPCIDFLISLLYINTKARRHTVAESYLVTECWATSHQAGQLDCPSRQLAKSPSYVRASLSLLQKTIYIICQYNISFLQINFIQWTTADQILIKLFLDDVWVQRAPSLPPIPSNSHNPPPTGTQNPPISPPPGPPPPPCLGGECFFTCVMCLLLCLRNILFLFRKFNPLINY